MLNNRSCLAPALGVDKYPTARYDFGYTWLCYISQTYMFNKRIYVSLLMKSSWLTTTLGMAKFTTTNAESSLLCFPSYALMFKKPPMRWVCLSLT